MQIIGLMLVKNEDIHIRRCIENIIDFCDRLIILDNYSKDQTWKIIREISKINSKIECVQIRETHESHSFVQKYVGTDTWVFAVDGDEIYDPHRLKIFRQELEAGKFDFTFSFYGHTLNCVSIDWENSKAKGYLTPKAKSVTKLYNFRVLTRWDNVPAERLHGGDIEFIEGYHYNLKFPYMEQVPWEESNFRCLHACFIKRSSLDKSHARTFARQNIYDRNEGVVPPQGWQRWKNKIKQLFIPASPSHWKLEKYAQGDCVEQEIQNFSRER